MSRPRKHRVVLEITDFRGELSTKNICWVLKKHFPSTINLGLPYYPRNLEIKDVKDFRRVLAAEKRKMA